MKIDIKTCARMVYKHFLPTLWFWPAWFDDPGHKVVQIVAGDAVAVRERVPGGGQGSLPPAQESMIKLVMEFIELNWSNEKS